MRISVFVVGTFLFGFCLHSSAQDNEKSNPKELKWLAASVGVWDAVFEVWPQGPDKPSIKFKGVETNKAHGQHWISSDLKSSFMGQEQKIHSIIGYDLDKKQLVGTSVDYGPYASNMTGTFNEKSNSVSWVIKARALDGKPMTQKTVLTNKSETERVLVMRLPGKDSDKGNKFMEIVFTKRKSE